MRDARDWRRYTGLGVIALLVAVRAAGLEDVPVSAVVVGPLLAASVASPRATALTSAFALAGAAIIMGLDGSMVSGDMAGRVVVVTASCAAAIILAAERARREAALSDAQELARLARRLDLALEASSMGTWVYNAATGITTWDERLETMYGFETGSYDGSFRSWIDRVHPEDRDLVTAASDQAIAERSPYQVLHRAVLPSGELRWLESRGEPIIADHRVIGTSGVVADVTERMTLANELERSRDESHQARHERDAATASLQTALLPAPRYDAASWRVTTRYRPGERHLLLGGDFFDVVETGSGLNVVIGDVCGHSAAAAGKGAALRAAWRAAVLQGASPAEALAVLDAVVESEADGPETFATACSLTFRPAEVTYSIAGHPAPFLADAEGVRSLDAGNDSFLLGFGMKCGEVTTPLCPPWTVFTFTDGLIEGRVAPGSSERFGDDRLRSLMETHLDAPGVLLEAEVDRLLDEVQTAHGARLPDDLAVVLVGRDVI
ncbi:MAG TPA: SpoIIE family protein phosphatase [Acidimicrobiales bacterium]|nr:SpoIIE family protein phosphatase [Acidimicrobiales bacterium]